MKAVGYVERCGHNFAPLECQYDECGYRDAVQCYRWRPIAEIHEDFGPCVLMHIDDPGHLEVGTNLDLDFDEVEWTHFTRITPLSHDEAMRMLSEMGDSVIKKPESWNDE